MQNHSTKHANRQLNRECNGTRPNSFSLRITKKRDKLEFAFLFNASLETYDMGKKLHFAFSDQSIEFLPEKEAIYHTRKHAIFVVKKLDLHLVNGYE